MAHTERRLRLETDSARVQTLARWLDNRFIDPIIGVITPGVGDMAGARTPEAMTTREISRLIVAAGRRPVERDTFYNVIGSPDMTAPAAP